MCWYVPGVCGFKGLSIGMCKATYVCVSVCVWSLLPALGQVGATVDVASQRATCLHYVEWREA